MKHPPAEALKRYRELVARYHRTLDLMSAAGLEDFPTKLADAAAYGEMIAGFSPAPRRLLDVGSGVGLPGIPLAVALPRLEMVLIERRRRRGAFLKLVTSHLDLQGVEVVVADVADLRQGGFEVVTAQAVASFAILYRITRHLHAEDLWLLSRKGDGWQGEIRLLEEDLGTEVLGVETRPLGSHGTLVAVRVPGGMPCPSSG